MIAEATGAGVDVTDVAGAAGLVGAIGAIAGAAETIGGWTPTGAGSGMAAGAGTPAGVATAAVVKQYETRDAVSSAIEIDESAGFRRLSFGRH